MTIRLLFSAALTAASCFVSASVSTRISNVESGLTPRIRIEGQPLVRWAIADRQHFYKVPGISVAVVNQRKVEWAKHWRYLTPTGESETFSLQPNIQTYAVDLDDICRWQLFRGAGNHAASPQYASFEVLTSVVFELGYETRAGALLHGTGEVQICDIRFATKQEISQLVETPIASE